MYQYLDRPPITGDIVEFQIDGHRDINKGEIHIVDSHGPVGIWISSATVVNWNYDSDAAFWKVIATKPGSEAQPGDTVMRISGNSDVCPLGSIFTAQKPGLFSDSCVYYSKSASIKHCEGLVLCKQPEQPAITQFNYDLIMQPNTVVHCTTEEQANQLLVWADSKGLKWPTGVRCSEQNKWSIYTVNTCYKLFSYTYGEKQYFTRNNYTILTFEQALLQPAAEQPAPIQLLQPTPQQKELPMNIQQLLTALFGAEKPTTDYDRRPAFLVVAYDRDGSQIGTATADSVDAVKEKVANTPELWGCKVLTYSLDQEVTVKVPVKASKAKLAVAAPTPITTSEDE